MFPRNETPPYTGRPPQGVYYCRVSFAAPSSHPSQLAMRRCNGTLHDTTPPGGRVCQAPVACQRWVVARQFSILNILRTSIMFILGILEFPTRSQKPLHDLRMRAYGQGSAEFRTCLSSRHLHAHNGDQLEASTVAEVAQLLESFCNQPFSS